VSAPFGDGPLLLQLQASRYTTANRRLGQGPDSCAAQKPFCVRSKMM
jgi:hypothetical protein